MLEERGGADYLDSVLCELFRDGAEDRICFFVAQLEKELCGAHIGHDPAEDIDVRDIADHHRFFYAALAQVGQRAADVPEFEILRLHGVVLYLFGGDSFQADYIDLAAGFLSLGREEQREAPPAGYKSYFFAHQSFTAVSSATAFLRGRAIQRLVPSQKSRIRVASGGRVSPRSCAIAPLSGRPWKNRVLKVCFMSFMVSREKPLRFRPTRFRPTGLARSPWAIT